MPSPVNLVIFSYWGGPVPYLELFGGGPVKKTPCIYRKGATKVKKLLCLQLFLKVVTYLCHSVHLTQQMLVIICLTIHIMNLCSATVYLCNVLLQQSPAFLPNHLFRYRRTAKKRVQFSAIVLHTVYQINKQLF